MGVAAWLEGLGLGQYADSFRRNHIDGRVLPTLTAEDLKELGVHSVGHRRLILDAAARLASGEGAGPREPERRQLTVMFVDLVGSTALAAAIDPEDMRHTLRAYQTAVGREVERFHGHVAKLMGDGVLCYFGWPQAHEDDAERAVLAGLAIAAAVARLTALGGAPLACRIGIATGLVVVGDLVGDGAAREEAVVGETPNLAARLQQTAEPGTVVVASSTQSLLGAAFELEAMGPQTLKGLGESVPAFRVIAARPVASRFEARQRGAALPLVGRERQLAWLLGRWAEARAGRGQAALLVGEPGIGKSRLAKALADAISGEPHLTLTWQCSPYHAGTPLWPVTEQLRLAAGFAPGDDDATMRRKLAALLRHGPEDAAEAMALMAALLGIEATDHPALRLPPARRRELTLQALAGRITGLAATQPVLALWEDAHWADPTSLELIQRLLGQVAGQRALLLLTSRPGPSPLGELAGLPRLALDRLDRDAVTAIARAVGHGKPLPPEVENAIERRSDGVPLFVEELTKAVLESGLLRETEAGWAPEGPLPAVSVPSSLHDSLMARLDRLMPVKQVAQVAACIGRAFDAHLLAAVMPLPKGELDEALARLVASGLVFRQDGGREAAYSFKHALVRDAAYASMLKSRRQETHAALAAALEQRFPEIAASQPELVARHHELSGQMGRAVAGWQRAGELAAARSATAEAVAHLSRALRCLATLPGAPENRRRELDLQTALGPALIHARGYAAPETGRAWARAVALSRELDAGDRMAPVLWGQYVYHLVRCEFGPSREAAEQLARLGAERHDEAARLLGIRGLAFVAFSVGELVEAKRHFEEATAGLARLDLPALTLAYGQHPLATALVWFAHALFILGLPDRGLACRAEALKQGIAAGSSNTRAYTLAHAAKDAGLRGETAVAVELAEAAIALSAEQGYAQWLAEARVVRGWAWARTGRPEEGLEELRGGIAAFAATGALHWGQFNFGLLAQALTAAGRLEEARHATEAGLARTRETGERWLEAELERLLGEILLLRSKPDTAEVERRFSHALHLAQRQGAGSWELRAATSLARLWADRGERRKAFDLLAPIHGRFTEGFATPDFQAATGLLATLR